ncbi:hypothetical protein [Caloranaerobacter azorensis]|uniref:hypothetical protein n=1 Tax=Caloranaerobacter azorensis TaxID=116090 RepID=UPI0011603D23|nr:hypothetical protein [Caloranaerobacter azorensis]
MGDIVGAKGTSCFWWENFYTTTPTPATTEGENEQNQRQQAVVEERPSATFFPLMHHFGQSDFERSINNELFNCYYMK